MNNVLNQLFDKLSNDDKFKKKIVKPAEDYITCKAKPIVIGLASIFAMLIIILLVLLFYVINIHKLAKNNIM
jgi:hypothetical protein